MFVTKILHDGPGGMTEGGTRFDRIATYADGSHCCCAQIDHVTSGGNKLYQHLFVGVVPCCTLLLSYTLWSCEQKMAPSVSLCIILLLFIYLHFIQVTKESILVVRDLGIQITKTFFTGRKVSEFIPASCTKDVLLQQSLSVLKVINFIGIKISNPGAKCTLAVVGGHCYNGGAGNLLSCICDDILMALDKLGRSGDNQFKE